MKDVKGEYTAWHDHSGALKCDIKGCVARPQGGKSLCPNHVEGMPYAREIIEIDEARRREAKLLECGGKVPKQSYYVDEAIKLLKRYGPKTARRITRELNLRSEACDHLVFIMARRGLVTLSTGTRHQVIVRAK